MVTASKRPAWIALAVALVIHIGLISLQARRRFEMSFVRVWVMDALSPAEKIADRTFYGVYRLWDRYVWLIGVHDENERLKRANQDLQLQIFQQRESLLEAERIRTLAGLQEMGLGKTVVARVIGWGPGDRQTVTIDKGAVHGVQRDAAVLTSSGVVGRVIHSSNFFSTVQLVVDSQSAVGVFVQPNRRHGIVKGNGGKTLALDYIDDDNDLKVGEMFMTSGQDRIYPKGLPVGVISEIDSGPRRGLLRTVEIRPSADLGRLEEVLVVIERQASVDEENLTDMQSNP
jgi:rod shape-determining protein MreC